MRRLAALAALVLLLAACAAGPASAPGSGPGERRGTRSLSPTAQPTSVIATELAFARAAREDGQWVAYRRFAAPDAQVQWGGTSASAGSWLAGRTEPPAADGWVPRQAWSSCDGSAVVVAGSSRDSAGSWSRFTRVWERQRNGEFRWVYTRSTPDPELTRARQERESAENEELGDDAILVEAANFIRARVADCTVPPSATSSDNSTQGVVGSEGLSRDRTLRWFWDASPSEPGRFVAHSWTGTDWEVVHAEPLGAAGE